MLEFQLSWFYIDSRSCCEFMSAMVLLCSEDTVLVWSSPIPGYYNLSASSSVMVPDPWGSDVMQLSHLWLRTLQKLILCTLITCEFLSQPPSSAQNVLWWRSESFTILWTLRYKFRGWFDTMSILQNTANRFTSGVCELCNNGVVARFLVPDICFFFLVEKTLNPIRNSLIYFHNICPTALL